MTLKELKDVRKSVYEELADLKEYLALEAEFTSKRLVKDLMRDDDNLESRREAFIAVAKLVAAEDMLDQLNQAFDRLEKVLGESDEHQANQQADMRL